MLNYLILVIIFKTQSEVFMNSFNNSRIFWYDTETDSLDKAGGQILTAAAVITRGFEIEEEFELEIKPRLDAVPDPMAFKTHQLDIDALEEKGVTEFEASTILRSKLISFGDPTIITGYNNIAFDDDQLRHTFFRSLSDVYGHEYKEKNRKFDIYKLIQLVYATQPELINWPDKTIEDGTLKQGMKLEELANMNGIEINAHDAMSDVRATIGLAKLIHEKNPRIVNYLLSLTNKNTARSMLVSGVPVLNIDRMNGVDNNLGSLLLPLVSDAQNPNKILTANLRDDPREMLKMEPEELRHFLFTSKDKLAESEKKLVSAQGVTINKLPILLKADQFYNDEMAKKINTPRELAHEHAQLIKESKGFRDKLREAFSPNFDSPTDTYGTIYSSFFSNKDTSRQATLHPTTRKGGLPDLLATDVYKFALSTDDKIRNFDLALRAKWSNYMNELLDTDDYSILELSDFHSYLSNRMYGEPEKGQLNLPMFYKELERVRAEETLTENQSHQLDILENHMHRRESYVSELGVELAKNAIHVDNEKEHKKTQVNFLDKLRRGEDPTRLNLNNQKDDSPQP